VPGTHYTAEELTGTTQAVRSYAASASQAEKEKKFGQQKWGLFETNYQRNKGITTDESLQEIEVWFVIKPLLFFMLADYRHATIAMLGVFQAWSGTQRHGRWRCRPWRIR